MTRHLTLIFLILTILFCCVKTHAQNLSFGASKSKRTFALQTGRKYTLTTKDGKILKGIVTVNDVDLINIDSEGDGPTAVEVKNLKTVTERRSLWYIAAWHSLIKRNKTINVESAKVKFHPKIY